MVLNSTSTSPLSVPFRTRTTTVTEPSSSFTTYSVLSNPILAAVDTRNKSFFTVKAFIQQRSLIIFVYYSPAIVFGAMHFVKS